MELSLKLVVILEGDGCVPSPKVLDVLAADAGSVVQAVDRGPPIRQSNQRPDSLVRIFPSLCAPSRFSGIFVASLEV